MTEDGVDRLMRDLEMDYPVRHRWEENGALGVWTCVSPDLGSVPKEDDCGGCGRTITHRDVREIGLDPPIQSSLLDLYAYTHVVRHA